MTRCLQSTRFRVPSVGTDKQQIHRYVDIANYRLNRPRGQFSGNVLSGRPKNIYLEQQTRKGSSVDQIYFWFTLKYRKPALCEYGHSHGRLSHVDNHPYSLSPISPPEGKTTNIQPHQSPTNQGWIFSGIPYGWSLPSLGLKPFFPS